MKFKADQRAEWKAAVLAAASYDDVRADHEFVVGHVFCGGSPGEKITLGQILDSDTHLLRGDGAVTDYSPHTYGPYTPWGYFAPGRGGYARPVVV
jgi:hypothetical protein